MVVLDYDESTVENTFDFYEAYCQALKTYGVACPSYEEFIDLLSGNALHEKIPGTTTQEEFWKLFRRIYPSRHSWVKRGLKEFLIALNSFSVKVVVISGRETPSQVIWQDIRKHGLEDYISNVYTLFDLAVMGGNEEFLFDKSYLIKLAKRKYGKGKVHVCIGDYVTDYYSCARTGGIFIGVNSIPARNGVLRKVGVQFVATDFFEVLLILSKIGLLS